MSKERVSLDIDMPDFQPKPRQNLDIPAEAKEIAERSGFTARHAPAPPPTAAPFDARSLRRTNRNAKLNISTTEESRQRFWMLAQRMGSTAGEEVLIAMMNALENELTKLGR